ncbi:MAG: phenylacetic acid degradation operon negative regulatory protein PaaX [Thiolinea sp.]
MYHEETAFSHLARQLITEFAASRPMHANTLLVTVYGDTICPFGGTIWLGSLIKLVEPLGINHRLVRTSVYRLTEKNILQSRQIGRRSYYTLTERGVRQFESASRRIYAESLPGWNGGWQLVMTALGNLDADQREAVRKELVWLGFSRLAAGLYIHPTADTALVQRMLEERGLNEQVVMLNASASDGEGIVNKLISQCLDNQRMDDAYCHFIKTFRPLLEAARQPGQLNPELCFLVRTLLIHKYRHILLHEPELPAELLPADSANQQARSITRELYLRLSTQSDGHFQGVAESVNGALKQAVDGYYQRFGGV